MNTKMAGAMKIDDGSTESMHDACSAPLCAGPAYFASSFVRSLYGGPVRTINAMAYMNLSLRQRAASVGHGWLLLATSSNTASAGDTHPALDERACSACMGGFLPSN